MSFDIIWNQNVIPVINLILLQIVPLIKPIIACGMLHIVRLHCLHEIKYSAAKHYFIVRWWEMFIRITADHFENYTISCGSELKHVDWAWCEFANQTLPPHHTYIVQLVFLQRWFIHLHAHFSLASIAEHFLWVWEWIENRRERQTSHK